MHCTRQCRGPAQKARYRPIFQQRSPIISSAGYVRHPACGKGSPAQRQLVQLHLCALLRDNGSVDAGAHCLRGSCGGQSPHVYGRRSARCGLVLVSDGGGQRGEQAAECARPELSGQDSWCKTGGSRAQRCVCSNCRQMRTWTKRGTTRRARRRTRPGPMACLGVGRSGCG